MIVDFPRARGKSDVRACLHRLGDFAAAGVHERDRGDALSDAWDPRSPSNQAVSPGLSDAHPLLSCRGREPACDTATAITGRPERRRNNDGSYPTARRQNATIEGVVWQEDGAGA